MQSFSSITKQLLKNHNINPIAEAIFDEWNSIVGNEYAQHVKPSKIIKLNDNNVLVLKTTKCCATELQHDSFQLLLKINQYFHSNFFSAIRVVCDAASKTMYQK